MYSKQQKRNHHKSWGSSATYVLSSRGVGFGSPEVLLRGVARLGQSESEMAVWVSWGWILSSAHFALLLIVLFNEFHFVSPRGYFVQYEKLLSEMHVDNVYEEFQEDFAAPLLAG